MALLTWERRPVWVAWKNAAVHQGTHAGYLFRGKQKYLSRPYAASRRAVRMIVETLLLFAPAAGVIGVALYLAIHVDRKGK